MNAGMNTSGNCVIGAIEGRLSVTSVIELTVAVVKAMTKSRMPSVFQSLNPELAAASGSVINRTIHHGAAMPIAMSPRPAGQANNPGNT